MKKILLIIIVIMLVFSVNSTVLADETEVSKQTSLEDWSKSVVRIVAFDKKGNWLWHGSGFAIGEGDAVEYFVTNNHVIDGEGEKIDIYVLRSKDHLIEATVEVALPISDLAVIRTREKLHGYTPFVLCDEEAAVSSHCFALGFPGAAVSDSYTDSYAEDISITNGIISRKTELNGVKVYQTNTDLAPGNSGGPLLNEKFEVIAVNSFKIENAGAAINGSVYISGVTDVLKSKGIKYISSSDIQDSDGEVESSGEQVDADEPAVSDDEQSATVAPQIDTTVVQETVQEEKNDMKLMMIIAAIVILLIIIAVVVFLLVKGKSKSKGLIMGANLVMPYEISEVPVVIGRDGSICNIVENVEGISRRHCTISYVDGVFVLVDLSSNGTYLSNGTRLEKNMPYRLNHGDSFYLVDESHSYQLSDK